MQLFHAKLALHSHCQLQVASQQSTLQLLLIPRFNICTCLEEGQIIFPVSFCIALIWLAGGRCLPEARLQDGCCAGWLPNVHAWALPLPCPQQPFPAVPTPVAVPAMAPLACRAPLHPGVKLTTVSVCPGPASKPFEIVGIFLPTSKGPGS